MKKDRSKIDKEKATASPVARGKMVITGESNSKDGYMFNSINTNNSKGDLSMHSYILPYERSMSRTSSTGDIPKILQIVPAQDWYASYHLQNGEISYSRLISWALVENCGIQYVTGIDTDSEPPFTNFAEDCTNFAGYVHQSEMA